jgi:fructosamine-3-kinase
MPGHIAAELNARLGAGVAELSIQHGGCVGEVYRVLLDDGRDLAVKVDRRKRPTLDIEAFMLDYLARHSALPVPRVVYSAPELLAMTFLPGESHFSANAQLHAAELLAELHGIAAPQFGLERDTLVGSLDQPNPIESSWIVFFREHRLLHFARKAFDEKKIQKPLLARIERLAGRLDDLLEGPPHPSLLHGDVWSGNVLALDHRVTGFIDPAIYFGHPEIELAFITLFDTFGANFFNRYNELRPIRPGFFEQRAHVYNLFPLLVHVRLFGGGYVASVDETLRRVDF